MTTTTLTRPLSGLFPLSQNLAITWQKKLVLAFAFACLTGLLAQIRIPLPFTPVPISGQTFAVCLSAMLLGKNWGGLSQILYVAIGTAGMPWFTDMSSGVGVLFGPTGGYLIGFVVVGFVLGYVRDRFDIKGFIPLTLTVIVANFVCVFVPGLIVLGLWLSLVKGQTVTLTGLLSMGYFPFVIGDLIKSFLAAPIVNKLIKE